MTHGLVVHVELGENKHTEVTTQERVRIGSREDCDLRLRPPFLLSADNLLLELARSNGHYIVNEFNRKLRITHNGLPLLEGAAIEDGDEVRVESSGLALQFFPLRDLPVPLAGLGRPSVQVAPFIEQAAVEAAATARRDDAKVFLREFTRELLREINISTKLVTLLLALALTGGVLYLTYSAYRELRRSRDLINQQNEQMLKMQAALDETQNKIGQAQQKSDELIAAASIAGTLYSRYGGGVCLITGTYVLVDADTGQYLRYPQAQTTEDGTPLQDGDAEQPVLTPEGNGPVFIRDFEGTGFHVGGGYVVTNRHLALEPWKADERVEQLSASVRGRFRLTRLVAFFPGRRQAFVLRFKAAAASDDIAVCQIDKDAPADLPVLALDKSAEDVNVGKRVVMIGFPRGADRLLATYLPENESRNLQTRYGSSAESLLAALAERMLIKPSTTEGTITDMQDHRIAYNASSAEGASGAPLFGPTGRVIGVNFGSYIYMTNANYCIPVRYAFAPLQRAGWTPPEPPADPNANTNSNAAPKDARANAPNANKTPASR